jgi:hypothetical protein
MNAVSPIHEMNFVDHMQAVRDGHGVCDLEF